MPIRSAALGFWLVCEVGPSDFTLNPFLLLIEDAPSLAKRSFTIFETNANNKNVASLAMWDVENQRKETWINQE
jgi:hypothetical protein